jgi:8-oxo-dGTP pyrophosphatase MutT (NUDIX family)
VAYEKRNERSERRPRRENRPERRKRLVSAGFVVRSKEGKFLIGKTTKYPKKQCWTVFKGQQEDGESLIATAVRELREEAGIDILRDETLQKSQSTSPFFTFPMKDKDVVLYLLNDDQGVLDDAKFKCSSYWGSERTPEICDYKWATFEEMSELIFPSQRGLIEYLKGRNF